MTDDVKSLGEALFSGVWDLFGVTVPGFSFSFGQLFLVVALCGISILVLRLLFGFGGDSGVDSRTSSTSNPHISEDRRYDEY